MQRVAALGFFHYSSGGGNPKLWIHVSSGLRCHQSVSSPFVPCKVWFPHGFVCTATWETGYLIPTLINGKWTSQTPLSGVEVRFSDVQGVSKQRMVQGQTFIYSYCCRNLKYLEHWWKYHIISTSWQMCCSRATWGFRLYQELFLHRVQ